MVTPSFLTASSELKSELLFGFILPEYRPLDGREIARLPTPRATLYYAADVTNDASGECLGTGLFCEGPHSVGFRVTHACSEMVAVKVRGGALRDLLGVPAKEVRDATVTLASLWGHSATELVERMAEAASPQERYQCLQLALARRTRGRTRAGRLAGVAAKVIEDCRGNVQVDELSRRLGCTRRSLLNAFDEWVGLTPKQYARLVRLRGTIALSADARSNDWARIAAECGFYDQAHLIHEFRALLGRAPIDFTDRFRATGAKSAPALGRSALPRLEQRLYQSVGPVSEWADGNPLDGSSARPRAETVLPLTRPEHRPESSVRRRYRVGGVEPEVQRRLRRR